MLSLQTVTDEMKIDEPNLTLFTDDVEIVEPNLTPYSCVTASDDRITGSLK